MGEGGKKISDLNSLPCFLIFEIQKRNGLGKLSGYFTGNCAADAAHDKEYEAEYCYCCLVCLQPAM